MSINVFTEPKLLEARYKPIALPVIYLISFALLGLIMVAFLIAIRHPYDGFLGENSSGTAEFSPALELLKRLTPLFVAGCFALFSFGIWAYQPYDRRVILFWAFNQLGAAGLTFGALSTLGYSWATCWFGLALCLFSPVLVHFHAQATHAAPQQILQRVLQGFYALSLILALIWLYGTTRTASQEYRIASLVIQVYFVTAVIITLFLLMRASLFASLQSWRWQVRLVVFGTLFAFMPLVALALLPDLLLGRVLVAYELTFPFLLFMPLSHTISIYHANLLQIERLINRRVIHLSLLVILSIIYLVVFIVLSNLWSVSQEWEPLLWGVTTLFLGLLFALLRDRLQEIIDRIIYGGWYNYRSVVAEMSRGLGHVVDREALADLLVNRLADILRLECAALLLSNDEMQLTLIRAVGYHALPATLSTETLLITNLARSGQAVSTTELCATLSSTPLSPLDKMWLEHPQIKIWIPIERGSAIQALLLLGKRLDGELFDDEDRRMLNTLAWGAGTAVENVKLVNVLKQRTDEVNRLYSQLLQSREEERKRLARELHDGVIQNLINLHYYLDPVSRRLAPTAEENIAALRSRLQQVIDELRDVCTQLRPAALDDLSLALAIQGHIEDIMDRYDLDIILKASGGEFPRMQRLPEDIEVCLFRVMQEAIANVSRHADATTVWINLSLEPDHAVLEVRDDGQGFLRPANLGSFTREHHFGLAGIQERLHLIGGTLSINSTPGEGTTLRAEVPVVTREQPSAWCRVKDKLIE